MEDKIMSIEAYGPFLSKVRANRDVLLIKIPTEVEGILGIEKGDIIEVEKIRIQEKRKK